MSVLIKKPSDISHSTKLGSLRLKKINKAVVAGVGFCDFYLKKKQLCASSILYEYVFLENVRSVVWLNG